MYVISVYNGREAIDKALADPMVPPFQPASVEQADRLVVRGTSFSDPAEYVEFELQRGVAPALEVLETQRLAGY
jgi:hypothetical protein